MNTNYCEHHLFMVGIIVIYVESVRSNGLPSVVGPQRYLEMENSIVIEVRLVMVMVVQIGVPGGGEDISEGSNSPQEAGGLSSH